MRLFRTLRDAALAACGIVTLAAILTSRPKGRNKRPTLRLSGRGGTRRPNAFPVHHAIPDGQARAPGDQVLVYPVDYAANVVGSTGQAANRTNLRTLGRYQAHFGAVDPGIEKRWFTLVALR